MTGAAGAVASDYGKLARRYFRVALFYLSLGSVFGALMMWFGNDNFEFFHGHMLLVGTLLFGGYGAGYRWIAGRAPGDLPPGASSPATVSLAVKQFWLANIGLPGMLLGSVLPVGYGLDRIGILFGLMEAAAAVMFAVVAGRAVRTAGPTAKPGR